MADQNRRAGIIYVKVDGVLQDAKGEFEYNLGQPKRDAIVGSSGVTGYKEVPQVPYIQGKITDSGTLALADLVGTTGATVTLELANGKVISGTQMWYAGEGKGSTAEGEIDFRFESTTPLQEVQ